MKDFIESRIEVSFQEEWVLYHNLNEVGYDIESAFINYTLRDNKPTLERFIAYIKSKDLEGLEVYTEEEFNDKFTQAKEIISNSSETSLLIAAMLCCMEMNYLEIRMTISYILFGDRYLARNLRRFNRVKALLEASEEVLEAYYQKQKSNE